MRPQLCIYHGNCADGFTGAWVVNRAYGEGQVEFHPGVYSAAPPDVTGKDVVLVDFSYKRSVMEGIIERANSVLVLDHHKTAEEDLRGLPGAMVIFDMGRAGCKIAWDHYFPGVTPPKVLSHVEDRDLWRFALPLTREVQACVFSYPYAFDVWDRLMSAHPKDLAVQGAAIERKHHKDIAELVAVTKRWMTIAGHRVPVASLPYTLTSDAGHLMAEQENAPFAACYWDTPAGRVFSLRSTPEGIDVSAIAKTFGGGGHQHAAGFTVTHQQARTMEDQA